MVHWGQLWHGIIEVKSSPSAEAAGHDVDGYPLPLLGVALLSPPSKFIAEQFIGLTDRDGKEIYEGDIVDNGNDIGVVTYSNRSAGFFIDSKIVLRVGEPRYMGTPYWGRLLGNIHEQPELLVK